MNLQLFSGKDVEVYDSNGSLYFYLLLIFLDLEMNYISSDLSTLINNKIQFKLNVLSYRPAWFRFNTQIKKVNPLHILLSFSIRIFFQQHFISG